MRVSGRWPLAGAIAIIALLAAPALPGATGSRVLAHAQLVASSPAAGVVLAESPPEIRLVFSEPLEAQASGLDVVGQDGTVVLEDAGTIDPADPYVLVIADPRLPDGVYSLTWRSLSAADGHTAEGFFTFGVGDTAQALPQVPGGGMTHADADPIGVAGRWLTYVGLLLALGIATFHRIVIRDGAMPRRLVRLLAAGLAVSAMATLVVAIASALEAGLFGDYLFDSRNGLLQTGRAVVASLGAATMLLVPRRVAGAVAAATGLVGIVLLVAAGHASAVPGPVPIIGQVVHVAGAGIWIGGIASLLLLQLRPDLMTDGVAPQLRRVVPRFSALALASIGLVVLSGVYAAWVQTGALVTVETEYGRTLLMKTGLATGALVLGGLNYLDGGQMRAWFDGFRTRVSVEALLIAAVLAMTAVLAATAPVEDPAGVAIEPIPDAFGAVAPQMGMQIIPGRPGVNRAVVNTTDALAAASSLELSLDRLDDGSTTRVPLTLEGTEGMGGMEGMDHGGMAPRNADGTVNWIADALVLPAGSSWDTSVRILGSDGTELSRQRFAFSLSSDGIDEGRTATLLTPATAVAAMLLVGGAIGLGLGLGGMSLPRCEATTSRVALLGGGTTAVLLGSLIGVSQLLAVA